MAKTMRSKSTETNTGQVKPPEWLLETPATSYTLEAYSGGTTQPEQQIDLTLTEYEALEKHLARMRGYAVNETDSVKEGQQ